MGCSEHLHPVTQYLGPLLCYRLGHSHIEKKILAGFSLTLSVSPASTQPHSKKLDPGLGLDP